MITFLASNAEAGSQEFTLKEGEARTDPPPHCHPRNEAFFVLDWIYKAWRCDNEKQRRKLVARRASCRLAEAQQGEGDRQ